MPNRTTRNNNNKTMKAGSYAQSGAIKDAKRLYLSKSPSAARSMLRNTYGMNKTQVNETMSRVRKKLGR